MKITLFTLFDIGRCEIDTEVSNILIHLTTVLLVQRVSAQLVFGKFEIKCYINSLLNTDYINFVNLK